MFIAILGRQPEISLAELEAVFGKQQVSQISAEAASVDSDNFDLSRLGGTVKYGQLIETLPLDGKTEQQQFIQASRKIVELYRQKWCDTDHKITLGLSAYGFKVSPRDVQKTGLLLKSALKKNNVSLRLIPNQQSILSTATSHNNKLGLSANKIELLIVKTAKNILIAESGGAQNIDAYTKRDQKRPKRDAFVGMLPPKLAQIMLNLAVGSQASDKTIVLDPFCGTGVVLQEALLQNYLVIGSDLNPKMVDYTQQNLKWLAKTHRFSGRVIRLEAANAMEHQWPDANQITAVVCETYLGQPFSAPPSPEKLQQVRRNCDHIISEFLRNIHPQINQSTPLCLAVPAWSDGRGNFSHLPLLKSLENLGYYQTNQTELLYHRPDQVVAREIVVLKKHTQK